VVVDKLIDNWHLEITFTEANQPKLKLFLYQCSEGMQDLVFIKKRADYWSGIINSFVRELPYPAKHNAS